MRGVRAAFSLLNISHRVKVEFNTSASEGRLAQREKLNLMTRVYGMNY